MIMPKLDPATLQAAQADGWRGVCVKTTTRRNGDGIYRAARIDWLLAHDCKFPTLKQTKRRFGEDDLKRYKLIHYKDLLEVYEQ